MKRFILGLFTLFLPLACIAADKEWFTETLFDTWQQTLKIDKIIYQSKTDYQDLLIFENPQFGRVLSLDGNVQLTEADEWVYHEMMVHVPLFAHGNVKKVLVIGGGDGGVVRELVKHSTIDKIVLVEIDRSVIELSEKYLPSLSSGAFRDERLQIVIQDGAEFVKTTDQSFDVVICDSPDPIGPGAALFTEDFFRNCKRVLNPKGIFINQNGVPFMQNEEVVNSYKIRSKLFKDSGFYVAPVPTYIGGFMTLGWATDELSYRLLDEQVIQKRFQAFKEEMHYYTPSIHKASFALPRYIEKMLK